jgi:adenylosuccinate lyase
VLLALIDRGFTRNEAYEKVQGLAFEAKTKGVDFKAVLREDERISSLFTEKEIEEMCSLRYHLKHVDRIFRRVGI